MSIYRKIYEEHFGYIPKEPNGRSYDIHHIDGNNKNNDSSNLKAVTLQEHYDIHHAQGDYYACFMIAIRLNKSSEELSEIGSKAQQLLVKNGTHHLLGGWLARKTNKRLIEQGIHNFQGPLLNQTKLANGTHPSQKHHTCPYCFKEGKGGAMFKHHFDNCKARLVNHA